MSYISLGEIGAAKWFCTLRQEFCRCALEKGLVSSVWNRLDYDDYFGTLWDFSKLYIPTYLDWLINVIEIPLRTSVGAWIHSLEFTRDKDEIWIWASAVPKGSKEGCVWNWALALKFVVAISKMVEVIILIFPQSIGLLNVKSSVWNDFKK